MFNFSKILPKTVTNELNSPKIAVWGFVLFTVLMTWRSIIHMLFESYGFHEIANFIVLTGDPDPMPVIYRFFSLWGNAQLMFCLVCWVVIFRYKSLIPLMSLFWVLDWGQRLFLYPLIREDITSIGQYTKDITPGVDLALLPFVITVVIFLISVANKKNRVRMRVWAILIIIYGLFFAWYTDFGGKLSDEEIQYYSDKFENNALKDGRVLEPRTKELLQKFMEEDSGKQFMMVNIIDMSENPTFPDGTVAEESSDALMNEYMKHMYGELLKRASHPAYFGGAVNGSMDLVGIENAEVWERAALFRYKSRRSFLEIVTHPDMYSKHKYKIAALEKTIAFPVENQFYLGDPRLLLGFILLIIGLLLRPVTRQ